MITVNDIINSSADNIKLGAIARNPLFIRQVADETYHLFQTNQARLGRPGRFFLDRDGTSSYYPSVPKEDPATLTSYFFAVNLLRVLREYKVVSDNTELRVRPIDWYNGSGAFVDLNDYDQQALRSEMGIPSRGAFVPSDRPGERLFGYHTFAGIDMQMIAVVGEVVSEPRSMKTLSYSVHREKKRISKFGRIYPNARSRGARTVAGSMIFTVFDEHPLLAFYPSEIAPKDMEKIQGKDQFWQPLLLPDQLPPFDLIVIAQNEYGHAMQMAIMGIDITDDSMVFSINDMEIECVVQYTALTIDVPRRVQVDKDGVIDPLSLSFPEFSSFWDFRQRIIQGLGDVHQDPYTTQLEYYEAIDAISELDSFDIIPGERGQNPNMANRNLEVSSALEEEDWTWERTHQAYGMDPRGLTTMMPRIRQT